MTRAFNGQITCQMCGQQTTAETAFERWMRNHDALDSRVQGIVRFDLDVLIHRYKTVIDKRGQRDIQMIFGVEVKTFGGTMTEAQRDTFYSLNQVLRNRISNRHQHQRGAHAEAHTPLARVRSLVQQRDITVWLRGWHCLRLSHDSPANSEWMEWDGRLITLATLLGILGCDLDSDPPFGLIDWRRRYSDFSTSQLAIPGLSGATS